MAKRLTHDHRKEAESCPVEDCPLHDTAFKAKYEAGKNSDDNLGKFHGDREWLWACRIGKSVNGNDLVVVRNVPLDGRFGFLDIVEVDDNREYLRTFFHAHDTVGFWYGNEEDSKEKLIEKYRQASKLFREKLDGHLEGAVPGIAMLSIPAHVTMAAIRKVAKTLPFKNSIKA